MAPPKGSTRTISQHKPVTEPMTNLSITDQLSYTLISKPFKKEEKSKKQNQRRNKTFKQIISAERYRFKLSLNLNKPNQPAPPPQQQQPQTNPSQRIGEEESELMEEENRIGLPEETNSKKLRNVPVHVGNVLSNVNYSSYMTIEAPPSVIPLKKYCDITGLEAPYVDPKSSLRYHNVEVYELIKSFGPGVDQIYLSLRGAHTTLK